MMYGQQGPKMAFHNNEHRLSQSVLNNASSTTSLMAKTFSGMKDHSKKPAF